jgi:hypothetical protein
MRTCSLAMTMFCFTVAHQSDGSLVAFRLLTTLNLGFAIAQTALAAEKATTFTGVIVQKGEEFLIAETENMTPLAMLQGVVFATENLANFVGQTVKVRGTLVTAKDGRKILRVKTMADIEKIPPPPIR